MKSTNEMSASFGEKPDLRIQQHIPVHPTAMAYSWKKKRNHPCTQCQSTFARQDTLNLHMKTHLTNANQNQCSFCSKVLRRRYDRQRHEEFCQNSTPEKREQRNRSNADRRTCKYCKTQLSSGAYCRKHENQKMCPEARGSR